MKKAIFTLSFLTLALAGNTLYAQKAAPAKEKSTKSPEQEAYEKELNNTFSSLGPLKQASGLISKNLVSMPEADKKQVLADIENAVKILDAYRVNLQKTNPANKKKK